MAFTQSCFIRKNTLELRKKLEELGYRYCSTFNEKAPYLWLGEGVIYDTFNSNIITIEVGKYFSPYGISCGTNEELFLALAALRDDANDNQWFIAQDTMWDENYIGEITVYYEYGEWLIWDYYSFMEDNPSSFRKATVEEIIEHFTMKGDTE